MKDHQSLNKHMPRTPEKTFLHIPLFGTHTSINIVPQPIQITLRIRVAINVFNLFYFFVAPERQWIDYLLLHAIYRFESDVF